MWCGVRPYPIYEWLVFIVSWGACTDMKQWTASSSFWGLMKHTYSPSGGYGSMYFSEVFLIIRWSSRYDQWWECKFLSEGIIDQGGGFRDSLSDVAEELCPTASDCPVPLPFFIRAPNQVRDQWPTLSGHPIRWEITALLYQSTQSGGRSLSRTSNQVKDDLLCFIRAPNQVRDHWPTFSGHPIRW